ncbi:MAG TPA: Zn-ribbon domain-containing OB-fold protein [Acidimicrobiales bacterium]|nr:Zn-ribbon domain-containing OB-fold protein [Acidimicrobiales bacterium]
MSLSLPASIADAEPVRSIRTPARLDYEFTAGQATSQFLRGVKNKKLIGGGCPVCGKVYVPPRGSCAVDGVPTTEQVDVADRGTVTTFCVVNVQFYGQGVEVPYVCATIQLDGADLGLFAMVQEMPYDQVRIGLRVEAVWVDDDELDTTLENIKYFRPTGEPDVDVKQNIQ